MREGVTEGVCVCDCERWHNVRMRKRDRQIGRDKSGNREIDEWRDSLFWSSTSLPISKAICFCLPMTLDNASRPLSCSERRQTYTKTSLLQIWIENKRKQHRGFLIVKKAGTIPAALFVILIEGLLLNFILFYHEHLQAFTIPLGLILTQLLTQR